MKKLRVGVVGAGYLGRFHAEKYARMDDVELIGVVDINKSQAEEVAGRFNTKAYPNHQYLFGKVDAVSIVVPTPAHFSVAKDFLENNIDVLIEKPMSETTEEADDLIRFSKSRGLKKPMFIESHRLSIYKDRCTDVSVVLDLMIHDIDIILNFVRSEIVGIHAAGVPVISGQIDIANARLEFKTGCIANVTASRISTKNERKIRLFQKNAYISVDFANQGITVIQQNDNIEGGLIPGMEIKQLSFAKGDALEDELKSFVKAVRRREAPEVTGQMGRDALKIALSIMKQISDTNSRFLH
jgi:predicted dehydrogenase